MLIETIEGNQNVCGYGSYSFKAAELNNPSSHKDILALKKTIHHFILFLKPVKFVIRTDLKTMPRIFQNENIMAENSSRILKWFIWLSNFDYEIIYKPGYLNCLANMLTRENSQLVAPSLSMFTPCSSSSGLSRDKGKAPIQPLYHPRNGLFLKPWDESIAEEERKQLLDFASRKEVEKYLEITLTK